MIFWDQKFLKSGASISLKFVTFIFGLNSNLYTTEIGSFRYGERFETSAISSKSSLTIVSGLFGDREELTASVTKISTVLVL